MRKKAAIIFVLRFIKLAFAVLNLSLSARYFGIALERDIWLLALNCMIVLDMAIWGPLNATFRSTFLFIQEEKGKEEAIEKVKSLFFLTTLITVVLVIFIWTFAKDTAALIAPEFRGSQLENLTAMIRILAPSLTVSQFTRLLVAVLNVHNSFVAPEITASVAQIITAILIIFLAPQIGILSLAIAYYIGFFLLLIALIIQVRKLKVDLHKNIIETKFRGALNFILLSLPFFLPYLIGQFSLIIEKRIASSMFVGAVSMLDYARKFSDIPLEVVTGILATMLLPILSINFAQNKKHLFLLEFKKMYQSGFLIGTIIMGMLTACPAAFINILYKKADVSTDILAQMSKLAMFYSWSVIPVFAYNIFGLALLSSKKGKEFALYGVFAQILVILSNQLLYKKFGIDLFPFSFLFAHLIAGCIMAFKFPVSATGLRMITLKYLSAVIGITCLMYWINIKWLSISDDVVLIICNLIILLLMLILTIFGFRLEERKLIFNFYKKLVR